MTTVAGAPSTLWPSDGGPMGRCRPGSITLPSPLSAAESKPPTKGTESMRRVILLPLLAFSFVLLARSAMAQERARAIEIHAHRFAFEPASITVHRGETVRLRIISEDVPHSLTIESLGINIAASKSHPGEAVFTAIKTGDFAGRCGRFCGSGHGHMKFVLHVTGD